MEKTNVVCLYQAMLEAEDKGFDSVVEMWEAQLKEKKRKEWEEVRQIILEMSVLNDKKKISS
jgi:hypothetical protein